MVGTKANTKRPWRRVFRQYRPRVLTLVVLVVVAALIVLANLSHEITRRELDDWQTAAAALEFVVGESADPDPTYGYHGCWNMSSGWPLVWHQHVFYLTPGPNLVVGWCYSVPRLVADAAIWLLLLAMAAGCCERLLRRYHPQWRWSLRTMLVAVALAAAFCALCAAVSKRAHVQDSVIDAKRRELWVNRWGPKWLDVIGADRYRQRLVGADLRSAGGTFDEDKDQEDEELLKQLADLPDLQYLFLQVGRVTPEMVSSLDRMRGLRILCIEVTGSDDEDTERQPWREGLAAIGKMNQLEELHLDGISLPGESLAELDGLTGLQSLSLEAAIPDAASSDGNGSVAETPPLLSSLPALPRLGSLNLTNSDVGDADLRFVGTLPRLKSLNLSWTNVTDTGLAELVSLNSLEELMLAGDSVTAESLESLLAMKRLKKLHLQRYPDRSLPLASLTLDDGEQVCVLADQLERCRRALRHCDNPSPELSSTHTLKTRRFKDLDSERSRGVMKPSLRTRSLGS